MVRCTQTEKYRRLQQVETWLADGYTRADILRLVRSEEWGISRAMTDVYIASIGRKWHKEYEENKKSHVETAIKRRERLFLRALKKDDLRTALAVQDSSDKIKGLFVDRIETVDKRQEINLDGLSDEQLDEIDRRQNEINKILEGGKDAGSESPAV